jgi:hypothetical protein
MGKATEKQGLAKQGLAPKQILAPVLAMGAFFWLSTAWGAPPQGHTEQMHVPSQMQPGGQRLDLRPPSPEFDAAEKISSFPSMSHRQSPAPHEQLQLPALSSDNLHPRSSVEDYVQRVHREGLPVARLFENKSALVHLGLNPKGKPGLWLVQKTR